jgi:chaperonin cofactor prefoldin
VRAFRYHSPVLRGRRRSTVGHVRTEARDFTKSLELEHRVARLELNLTEVRSTFDAIRTRLTALQAQLDHLVAKAGRP